MTNKCGRCGEDKQCMAGESAHPSNWYCARCDYHQEEIDRLRAELAERDNAVPVAYMWGTSYGDPSAHGGVSFSLTPPMEGCAYTPLYTHPPRHAVSEGDIDRVELAGASRHESNDSYIWLVVIPVGGKRTRFKIAKGCAENLSDEITSLLTAAPEARSEAEIQAEALEKRAERLRKGSTKFTAMLTGRCHELAAFANWLDDEAARLREGEKS